MSIADYATLQAKRASPARRVYVGIDAASGGGGSMTTYSSWKLSPPTNGATPSTAAAPNSETAGSWTAEQGIANLVNARIVGVRGVNGYLNQAGAGLHLMICDRLSHQGGLSGTTTGAQTTNLPTAAIPARDADTTGVGVHAMLEIYTTVGVTGTTFTASYTNSSGTAGQTTQAMTFGSAGFNTASTCIPFSMAAGDKGVRSVQSVTLAGSTGTAGNFGVTLYRPLVSITLTDASADWHPIVDGGGQLPLLPVGACLFGLFRGMQTQPIFAVELLIAED